MEHPIHIAHWHYHKHKHLAQQMRPQVSSAGQKINNPLHGIRSRCLPGMHPGSNEHHWLFETNGTNLLREERLIEKNLVFLLLLVVGSDSEKMHWPSLGRMHQNLLVKI